jgi:hypothetical protein
VSLKKDASISSRQKEKSSSKKKLKNEEQRQEERAAGKTLCFVYLDALDLLATK